MTAARSGSPALASDQIAVQGRLVGVRMHPRDPAPDSESAHRVRWLVQLGERTAREQAGHKALLQALEAAQRTIQAVPQIVQHRLDEVAAMAVEIGLAVAREVVGAALDRGAVDPTPVVARCLKAAVLGSDGATIQIRLHPEDLALVQERLADAPDLNAGLQRADFVTDTTLQRGEVRAHTGAGALRWDPQEVLEKICAEVRREAGR